MRRNLFGVPIFSPSPPIRIARVILRVLRAKGFPGIDARERIPVGGIGEMTEITNALIVRWNA